MRSIKGSLVGLMLASILGIVSSPAAFAHGGGGGGGHGGSFGHGGGHSGGFDGHGFAPQKGAKFAPHYSYGGHHRHGGTYSYGDPYWYDYQYYGYYDYGDGEYSDAQALPFEEAPSEQTIIAVQQELAKLGFYRGPIDGLVGPGAREAISWFQSVEKLTVTCRIDDPTMNALKIR